MRQCMHSMLAMVLAVLSNTAWSADEAGVVKISKGAVAVERSGQKMDAPVGTRDPQPFVNISNGVLRHAPGDMVLNARQAVTVREALNAYTIDGARFLGRAGEFGSLEAGKSADFVILDRDILALADKGNAEAIAGTKVLETWFRGARVYRAAARKLPGREQ